MVRRQSLNDVQLILATVCRLLSLIVLEQDRARIPWCQSYPVTVRSLKNHNNLKL